jgi:hypothetical protein
MSNESPGSYTWSLGLRAGDLVEVRSREEILRTLDANGELDSMPFMPEMLQFCGKRYKVVSRADKTCDTVTRTGGRRLEATVHLEHVRCDGALHGGCEAQCLLFWKEAWLRKVQSGSAHLPMVGRMAAAVLPQRPLARPVSSSCTERTLFDRARREADPAEPGQVAYRCQATELVRATRPLAWSDPRQYLRDVASGNVTLPRALRVLGFAGFRMVASRVGYRLLTGTYNRLQDLHGGTPWPYLGGELVKTPSERLNLEPGDLVEVKRYDEILATLDRSNKNRGLSFDPEMVPYCGKRFEVWRRVEKIVDERTGRMLRLPNDCVILRDVVCRAEYSAERLLCPRAIFSYWREIWLRRVEPGAASGRRHLP